ncbi:hypothetical protein C5E45_18980 [Nocardia nova]|uniref:Uncharacterized protein n=1 Tax=Nocardia nova TaxID=37330 RepID=A0A2S6AMR8_9NOCA|nr:hypothetical protein C5E45_18980 [Nocardia nova]
MKLTLGSGMQPKKSITLKFDLAGQPALYCKFTDSARPVVDPQSGPSHLAYGRPHRSPAVRLSGRHHRDVIAGHRRRHSLRRRHGGAIEPKYAARIHDPVTMPGNCADGPSRLRFDL